MNRHLFIHPTIGETVLSLDKSNRATVSILCTYISFCYYTNASLLYIPRSEIPVTSEHVCVPLRVISCLSHVSQPRT